MSNFKHTEDGFAGIEAVLIVIIIAVVGLVGWYVYHTKQNTDNALNSATSTSNNAGPRFASKKATAAVAAPSSATNNAGLQSDLNGVTSANGQNSQDINAANSSLNDQSTFTSVPQ